nr:AMP nucleosidase [uncultured Lichenicoccus sp.]
MAHPVQSQIGSGFSEYDNADAAVSRLCEIYDDSSATLRTAFASRATGPDASAAVYPYLAIEVDSASLVTEHRAPYGVLLEPGFYGTTLTRPHLFRSYLREQIGLLLKHYRRPVLVGRSNRPIPLPYVIEDSVTDITEDELRRLGEHFTLPDLASADDRIANCQVQPDPAQPRPLSLFTAERVDYSLARLHHYTGTDPADFQRFVLLTNYQRYIDEFRTLGGAAGQDGNEYERFVEPHGDPQMPAYHMVRPDGDGITLINIGVGPSNAKTITDHVAVLRPHCWLMLGHCAGLRRTQRLGDYVLAHGYVRDDHVLDDDLPPWVPVPPIAEVQVALQEATTLVTGLRDAELKTRLRTGTVMTTDNRNWELRFAALFAQINMTRSIAVDMESATIAANGFRFRVPYGTLLCVSDKPLHGELKLRGMARAFYRERISQHLHVGIETMRRLRAQGVDRLHSRKLRGFDEPPFR